MLVAGVDRMYYYSYRSEGSFLLEVKQDAEYASRLMAAEADFWRRLQECDPPELTDKDYVNRNDDEWRKLANEALNLQISKKLVDESLEAVKEKLMILAEGKSCIGGGIRFSL